MRTIKRILESLLDADFDIDVDDIGSLFERAFGQCAGLTDYESIPSNWK